LGATEDDDDMGSQETEGQSNIILYQHWIGVVFFLLLLPNTVLRLKNPPIIFSCEESIKRTDTKMTFTI